MLKSVKRVGYCAETSYIIVMELSKKSVGVIIALIVISLAGLVVLQTYLLKYAVELKEQAFRRNVFAAINSIVHQLESDETAATALGEVKRFPDRDSLNKYRVEVLQLEGDSNFFEDNMLSMTNCGDSSMPVWIANDSLHFNVPTTQHIMVQAFDQKAGNKTTLVDTCKTPGEYSVGLLDNEDSDNAYTYRYKTDSANIVINISGSTQGGIITHNITDSDKQQLVAKVINNLTMIEWEPIESRIDSEALDSSIAANLRDAGIDLDYVYGVVSLDDDSLRIEEPSGYSEELENSEFKASLFPHDIFATPNILSLYFPDHDIYMIKQIRPLLFATILFMLVIVICFIYTIKTIISQKMFGRFMVDFINNMTHEFKTPISSISLACEAIAKPEILSRQDKVSRYSQMIKDENLRMRNQVEKILQMAVLEERDFDLELTDIDLHELINQAVRNITLQVENRGGKITTVLEAGNHTIKADFVHLSNIIHNLLDNANKYSPDAPTITIMTTNSGNQIIIGIQDRGVGINEKAIKQVFNKYYRVPTGNIHDVKGFGLGLSYVKLMVEALGGSIDLESEPGQGTLVELSFPVLENTE
ncbi:MAG: HAMP domain-containing histidine kinase [candidate division Zixibacteria bacterium]|nr:HAMP domain-containing histidine kinase [candidate division Zixibacteria bacterium]